MTLKKSQPAFAISLFCTTSMIALSSAAFAQDNGSGTETVVVTGSRVISDAAASPTPLTVVSADQLQNTTPSTIQAALNKLPAFVGSGGATTVHNAGGNSGGSTLNLRNFGAQRTLVLLDGHRAPPSNTDGTVDIDILPQMLIQRVDVVTGGASAVYGSDAVTGVVNFVLDKHFTGIKVDANAGISNYEDGASYTFGVAAGSDLFGGRAHVEGSVRAFHQDDVSVNQRPVGAQNWILTGLGTPANPYVNTVNGTLNGFAFGGKISCTGCAASGQQFVANGVIGPFSPGTPTGSSSVNSGGDGARGTVHDLFSLVSNEESFGRFSYNVNDDTTVYVQAAITQNYDKATFQNQYIQNGVAANSFYYTNAYLSPAAQAALKPTTGSTFQLFEFINNQGKWGSQITATQENVYDITAGVDGLAFGKYDWNLYYTHGQNRLKEKNPLNMNNQRLWAANDAVAGAGGTVQCYVSTTTYASLYPGCTPINPFGPSSLTSSQFNYFLQPTYFTESNEIDNVGGSISGGLFDDWAGPVKAALSAEARWNSLGIVSNAAPGSVNCALGLRLCNTQTSLWQGAALAAMPTASENVWEFAGEVNIPLLKGLPLAQDLSLDIAGRYTDYSVTGSVETWKIGFDYHLNDEVRFRGTTSIDIRAPTLFDLYQPPSVSHGGYNDLHTGGTAGNVAQGSQGNPNLMPEISRTYTGGVVLTPDFIPGLTASIDYYNINMKNAIGTVQANTASVQQLCEAAGGSGPYCALYSRPLPFSNTTTFNYPTVIYNYSLNAAFQRTEGWDLELDYGFQLADVWADAPGAINLRMMANIVLVLVSQPYPNAPVFYTPVANPGLATPPSPSSKGRVTSFVSYNVGSWSFNLQDRWLSGFPRALQPGQYFAQPRVNSAHYEDITIDKKFTVDSQALDAYLSIQNIGNVMPPVNLADNLSSPGVYLEAIDNNNTTIYNPMGRYFTIGLRASF